jgi:hypothetical protein
MANDIVSAIASFLTPELLGKLATASGLDRAMTQTAVSAAVPSILSGLARLAGSPGGARQLAAAVADQPSDMLATIARNFTASAQMAEKGTGVLSSLLGGSTLTELASAVSRFAGIGDGPARTLMGLLTPLIMGVLGREQQAAGLDVNGLARMLTGQSKQIAAAMPAGFSRLIEASGFQEGIGPALSSDRRQYDRPRAAYEAPSAASMQRAVGNPTIRERVTWPYWVLPLLAVGGLLWYALSPRQTVEPARTTETTAKPTPSVVGDAGKSIYVANSPDNWSSIGSSPNDYIHRDVYNRANEAVGTIKDVLLGPDGKMAAVIVSIGRNLGIGDKDIAVRFSALSLQSDERDKSGRVVIDATKEALQAAPNFERRQAPKQ